MLPTDATSTWFLINIISNILLQERTIYPECLVCVCVCVCVSVTVCVSV